MAQQLSEQFDSLFATKTGYDALDMRIEKTREKKNALLLVLVHTFLPLHNNGSELGARVQARIRDINLQTISTNGTHSKDTFATIVQTARKMGVNIYQYLYDRLSKKYEMKSKDFKIRDIRNFFLITDTLGITHNIKKLNLVDKIILIRFYFKKTYKFYYLIDNFIVSLIKVIPTRFLQFLEFIFDKYYRNYVLKKLKI